MTQTHETLWSLTRGQRLRYAGTVLALGLSSLLMFGPPQLAKAALDVVVSRDVSAAPTFLVVPLRYLGVSITGSLRAALTVADTLLVPVQPRSFDLWAVEQLAELVKEARAVHDFRAVMILNGADSTGRDNEEAAEVLRETTEIELLPTTIGRRKAFPNAAAHGRSILEQSPKDAKAIEELTAVLAAVFPETAKMKKVAL